MKKLVIVALASLLIMTGLQWTANACPNPTSTKTGYVKCTGSSFNFNDASATWTCAANGNYRLKWKVEAAGQGGEYLVRVTDLTTDEVKFSDHATSTSACTAILLDLLQGHQYEIYVDVFCCVSC